MLAGTPSLFLCGISPLGTVNEYKLDTRLPPFHMGENTVQVFFPADITPVFSVSRHPALYLWAPFPTVNTMPQSRERKKRDSTDPMKETKSA
jgi:hypothetical protein